MCLAISLLLLQRFSDSDSRNLSKSCLTGLCMLFQVFVGSASEGLLMPGDKVIGINHQDTSNLTHLEAQNLIKSSGTAATVDVLR